MRKGTKRATEKYKKKFGGRGKESDEGIKDEINERDEENEEGKKEV